MIAASTAHPFSDVSLNRMRLSGDPFADAVALRVDPLPPARLLDEVIFLAKSEIGVYQEFLDQMNTVPSWVDWHQIEQARRVQLAFANVRMLAWLTGSLIEGYAIGKAASLPLQQQPIRHRLHDMTQLNLMLGRERSLAPGGPAHRAIMMARLHQAMARKILKEQGWNVLEQGEPLNQEDLAFAMIGLGHLTLRGMERLGAHLREEDHQAIHHFWRYAAYLAGTHERLLTTSATEQEALYQRIRVRHWKPGPAARDRVYRVMQTIAGQAPLNLSADMLCEITRLCIGPELATTLELPHHRSWQQAVRLYISANRGASFAHYHLPGMDRLGERINVRLLRNACADLSNSNTDQNRLHQTA